MLALFNFIPRFCPNCGAAAICESIKDEVWAYRLRAVCTCECGMHYQSARTDAIIKAAEDSEGDMHLKFNPMELTQQAA